MGRRGKGRVLQTAYLQEQKDWAVPTVLSSSPPTQEATIHITWSAGPGEAVKNRQTFNKYGQL